MSALLDVALPAPGVQAVLDEARRRGAERGIAYAGLLYPAEAHDLVVSADAILVDVRAKAEWELVGRVPGSVLVEWRGYPCNDPNPRFIEDLEVHADRDDLVLFLCRSGQRSHQAAKAAARAGFVHAYNVLEGFEGDLDGNRQRGTLGGWRKAGLPWIQN
jgi:rhodanese-related sulfurtransferase